MCFYFEKVVPKIKMQTVFLELIFLVFFRQVAGNLGRFGEIWAKWRLMCSDLKNMRPK